MSEVHVTPSQHATRLPIYCWYDSTNNLYVPGYLTWEHARIHDGKAYDCSHLRGLGSELGVGANLDILIQANAGMHLVFEVACGGNAEVYFYNAPTFSNQGTAISVFNKNDYSTNVTTNVITHTPTLSSAGTQRMARLLPGGLKAAGSGGADGSYNREMDLKAGNDYLIRVTNISGAIQPTSVSLEWYEL